VQYNRHLCGENNHQKGGHLCYTKVLGKPYKRQDETERKMTMNLRPTTPLQNALYRHGDVLISKVVAVPAGAQLVKSTQGDVTLAYGEVTGHSHRIRQTNDAQLWVQDNGQSGSETFLEITNNSATLIHEEHKAIELPRGVYRVWKQREYRPDAYVDVMD
jgi:hypothetical protein